MCGSGWTAAARPTEPGRTSSTGRLLLAFGLCGLLLAGATVAAGAAVLYGSGSFSVEIEANGRGDSVRSSLPGGADSAPPRARALRASRRGAPCTSRFRDLRRELERIPDGVLLDLEKPGEAVGIEKRAGELLIRADTEGERVRIALPLRALSRLAGTLEERTKGAAGSRSP